MATQKLLDAASSGDVEQLTRLLSTTESPLSNKTVTALHSAAAWKAQVSTLTLLLKRFPSVPVEEEPVRAACYQGSIPLFSALLDRDPSVMTMPLDKYGSPLAVACVSGQPIEFLRFLLERGADPNQDPDVYAYPIAGVAVSHTDTAIVDLLLDYGAKLEGSGALSTAALLGRETMLRHYFSRGARLETDKPWTSPVDHPPLHNGVRKAHAGVVKLLVENGADVSAVSKGRTALQMAEEMQAKGQDMSEVMALLTGQND